MLIIFDDMIADMLSNKKLNLIVTELFIRGRKLNISIVLITQYYFTVSKKKKKRNLIQRTISFRKFQIKKTFNKLHLITHHIWTFKTLL